jgi:RND family efflux transporter MFP subunit
MSTTLPDIAERRVRPQKTLPAPDNRPSASPFWRRFAGVGRRKLILAGLTLVGSVLLFQAVALVVGGMEGRDQPLVFYTVPRADLPITVTERGNLESQSKTEIACEVENISSSRNGNSGTQILYIVPNGSQVKEGDLLVDLDSAPIQEMLDQQVLEYAEEESEQIQAKVTYENQKSVNETTLAEAELAVVLTRLELTMYDDGSDGTFLISQREMELEVQEAKNQIAEANANLAMETTELEGISMLHKLGYKGRGELTQARLSHLKAQGALVKAKNQLAKESSDVRKLTEFESKMERLRLGGALSTAERKVGQVKKDNEALLAEAKARLLSADSRLAKEEERLKRYRLQLEKCKIVAPHDGMAVYSVENSRYNRGGSPIAEGAVVRERQKLLTLPDLTRMQVKTAVHESVLDKVRVGMPVTIRIDAFPERAYRGTVESVAVLPDQGGWMSSDIKVYETCVTIDEHVEQLKPGMTAVVEIHVDRLKGVLSVPVQAIVQISGESWCYVEADRGVERRMLTLGLTNDKFVEVREGLEEGDRVVLNPMAIVDESQEKQKAISPDAGQSLPPDGSGESQGTPSGAGDDGDAGTQPESGAPGRRQRTGEGAAGPERRSFDPMQFDADGDGKVSREELPERMRTLIDRLDADGDGLLDAQEAAAARTRQGQGGGRDGAGRRRSDRTGPDV